MLSVLAGLLLLAGPIFDTRFGLFCLLSRNESSRNPLVSEATGIMARGCLGRDPRS